MLIIDDKTHVYTSADYQFFKKRYANSYQFLIEHTDFLDTNSTIKERLYCYHNGIDSKKTCKSCENIVGFHRKTNNYATFCSPKCSKNDLSVQKKYEQTCIDRYGVSNTFQLEDIKEKIKQTNQERYGVDNPNKTRVIRQKIEQTNIERYGVKNPMHNETCKDKLRQTNIERYGVEYPTQSKVIRDKVKATFKKRYNGHPNQQHMPDEVLSKLNNYDWMYDQHITQNIPLLYISNMLDVNGNTVARYMNNHNIPISQQYNTSYEEKRITDYIRTFYSDEIIINDRVIIAPQELDIVLPELKIAIEYCGLYWHSDKFKDKNYHLDKLEACNKAGYRLITIFEDEWLYNKEIIQSKLKHLLDNDPCDKVYARKCEVNDVSKEDKSHLLTQFHIQGNGGSGIDIGLYHDNNLLSVLSLKRHKGEAFEIVRFASSCNVIGGFSKLLTYFKRNYDWSEIYTFADRRWSEGDLYLKTGFEIDKILKPDYRYIELSKRIHKFNYRHANLKQKLGDKYNPDLSESKNTEFNNIRRIYDCGLIRFIVKK